MRESTALTSLLQTLDGKGYGAYKQLKETWSFPGFLLHVDHVQGDPFAAPTRLRVEVPPETAALPRDVLSSRPRSLGAAAFLARAFAARARNAEGGEGSGRSGHWVVDGPGQEVVPQTAVQIHPDGRVDARLGVGLPARGRRILGREADRLLADELPLLVSDSLLARAHDLSDFLLHAQVNEDAEHLRTLLPSLSLVAFVADGAVLPRRSGVDDRPMDAQRAVAFSAPPSLRVTVDLPNRGSVSGMGIPEGVTLIVGGGFHGKSTLLRAVQTGVVNHRPGDGRELVVAVPDAVKVRAEDGRSVAGVDISSFIDGLPGSQDTHDFTTPNASGSTSQAAAIVEALEAGARTLLMDEDTCATNFMIRDRRMQTLVPKEGEPITPFVDRIREMYDAAGISSVLVLGGSGDYLDVADTVLSFRDYALHDVTTRARDVADATPTGRRREATAPFLLPESRIPAAGCLDPSKGKRPVSVRVPDDRTLLFGTGTVDLQAVEQLLGPSALRAVGAALVLVAQRLADGHRPLSRILDEVERLVDDGGLDALDPRHPGDFAAFRRFELAAVLNRVRSLTVV